MQGLMKFFTYRHSAINYYYYYYYWTVIYNALKQNESCTKARDKNKQE